MSGENDPYIAQALADLFVVTHRLDNGDETWNIEGVDLSGSTVILDLSDGHTYNLHVTDTGHTPRSPIKNARRKKK